MDMLIFGTVIIILFGVADILVFAFGYKTKEKGVQIVAERLSNSDCDIDSAIENIQVSRKDADFDVVLKKL